MFFEIKYSNYGDSHYSNEEYGDWYCHNDYSYEYAKISSCSGDVGLFPGEKEPEIGNYIYLVIVSYSSGDSFGHSSGNHIMLWAFTDEKKADELSELIILDNETSSEFDHEFKPLVFYDVPISTNDWKGYFENLEGCQVVKLELRK